MPPEEMDALKAESDIKTISRAEIEEEIVTDVETASRTETDTQVVSQATLLSSDSQVPMCNQISLSPPFFSPTLSFPMHLTFLSLFSISHILSAVHSITTLSSLSLLLILQEFTMEMYNDDASLEGPGNSSSTENLVTSSRKHPLNPFGKRSRYSGTDEDMLARAIQDSDEDDDTESKTSYI